MISSTEDECCPANSYSNYWDALKEDAPNCPRILMSHTMTHGELCDGFLKGFRRAGADKEDEDNHFAEALQAHLTPSAGVVDRVG